MGYIRLQPERKTEIPVITYRGGMMSKGLALVFATFGIALLGCAPPASAQVSVSVGVAPVCPYGYFSYAPYDCAPYGYYGPD
jgi:hypothetical protein